MPNRGAKAVDKEVSANPYDEKPGNREAVRRLIGSKHWGIPISMFDELGPWGHYELTGKPWGAAYTVMARKAWTFGRDGAVGNWRNYVQLFVDWLNRRRYISMGLQKRIVWWGRRKYGYGCAKTMPEATNDKYGMFAEGSFCPVDVETAAPLYPYGQGRCAVCKTPLFESYAEICFDDDLYRVVLPDFSDVDEEEKHLRVCNWFVSIIQKGRGGIAIESYPRDFCSNLCEVVWNTKHGEMDGDIVEHAKELGIRMNLPSSKTLESFPPEARLPLVSARFLDFWARYEQRKAAL